VTLEALFATTNPGKVREVQAILDGTAMVITTVPMFLGHEETGLSYLENARLKAVAAVRLSGRAVLAEDAGLEVDALGGLPGPRSARFAGPAATDRDNNAKLLRLLDGVPEAERTARYRAVAVLVFPSGAQVTGEGTWEGRIATSPRGEGGFGYDPLFVPQGETRTAAELLPEEKNAASHRGQALRVVARDAV
jgi:XTP/dITP diphosphohydrolase